MVATDVNDVGRPDPSSFMEIARMSPAPLHRPDDLREPETADRPLRVEIEDIGQGFLAGTFPGSRFHHREHLLMATYLLMTQPAVDWAAELPDRIRAYNVSQGGENTDVSGYHHTITMFYLDRVREILSGFRNGELEEVCEAVLRSPAADQTLILRYFSRDRLFSPEARSKRIDPDNPVTLSIQN